MVLFLIKQVDMVINMILSDLPCRYTGPADGPVLYQTGGHC